MKAHFFQHVPFENLGCIESWLHDKNYAIDHTPFFDPEKAQTLPSLDQIDFLIILGGPMGVGDHVEFPWLCREKEFIHQAIARGKKVLGICLGAQLMARALGAKVYPNPVKEIGWFPINGQATDPDLFSFPPAMEVFHWHGDTFALPAGARLLASSRACPHQGFQMGPTAIGLQCHLETTPASVQALVENCGHELVGGPHIQTATTMLAPNAQRYAAMHQLMFSLLDFLHSSQNC